jgi:hypothetical protein
MHNDGGTDKNMAYREGVTVVCSILQQLLDQPTGKQLTFNPPKRQLKAIIIDYIVNT